jgi:hypothetical protein
MAARINPRMTFSSRPPAIGLIRSPMTFARASRATTATQSDFGIWPTIARVELLGIRNLMETERVS